MIPVADPQFGEREIDAVRTVLESGYVADGPEVRSFEREFADYCGAEHAVATSNGTTALHAAIVALGLGEGDRIVTTPFSFVASANAIRLAGATPVFADIDPETYTLDPAAAERAVRETGADAILAVHLYGLAADMDALGEVAADTDTLLIEDAAQAHGATYHGDFVGTLGDAACFSFYPTKNMTTGEGGMVLTDDQVVADRAASFINHGRGGERRYDHAQLGHNFRLTSIAAAIGRVQLERLADWIDRRRANAARLTDAIEPLDNVDAPVEPAGYGHAYHQYTVRCADRDAVRERLAEAGVDSGIYYPTPIHQLGAYDDTAVSMPVTERAATEVLSLPVHPALTDAEVDQVASALSALETQPLQ